MFLVTIFKSNSDFESEKEEDKIIPLNENYTFKNYVTD